MNFLTIFILMSALMTLVFGQDTPTDDAIFNGDLFDETISEAAAADSQNRLRYLPGISFVSEAAGYHSFSPGTNGSDGRFYGKAFLKATKEDIGSLYLGYNYSWFLYASAGDEYYRNFYSIQKPDPQEIRTSLSEFHLSFDIRKLVFIRIGSQLLSWGATFFWTPEDFINRQKLQASVISVVDIRSGKPGIRLHLPYKTMNLFLFMDFSKLIADKTPGSLENDIAQAWRIDGTIHGVQLGTVGYIGKNRPEQIGFDATGNITGIDIYGECALTFMDALNSAPHGAFSIGASRLFGKEKNWTARTEFYCNTNGYLDVDQSRLLPGEFTPLYSGRYYLYGELSGVNLWNSMLAIALFGYGNLADRSWSATIQSTIDLPGVLPFTVYGRYYGGRDGREFTNVFGGNAFSMGLRIRADF